MKLDNVEKLCGSTKAWARVSGGSAHTDMPMRKTENPLLGFDLGGASVEVAGKSLLYDHNTDQLGTNPKILTGSNLDILCNKRRSSYWT